mmetsp:Transcript_98100/g.158173  ORF Transcript_98100/g.158173 Transcript_98100/m.158173 type:complete len:200 (-) Transcript_98100:587-1186(-)
MGGGGGGKACVFKCAGGVSPRAREGHKPTWNGCGVPGFMVDTQFGMTECCNAHDICYHTCKIGKEQKKGQDICDTQFEKCMQARCQSDKGQDQEGCNGEVSMMTTGVRMFGCGAYESSQAEACACDLDANDKATMGLTESERLSTLLAFYAKHDASKTKADMDALVKKYKKSKFVELCRKLQDKYQQHPAAFIPAKTEL